MLHRILVAALLTGTSLTLTAQSTPSFELSRDVYTATTDGFSYNSVVTGDFNNDGKPDYIFAGGAADTDVTLYLGNGDGTFQAPKTIGSITNYDIIDMAVADLNKDGKLDLVVAETSSDERTGNFEVFYGNGDGTFAAPVNYVTENGPLGIGVGDLNGDGYPDIAVGDFDGLVEIWNNQSGTSFALAKTVPIHQNLAAVKARVGQMNGSGPGDIVAQENGIVYILWNDGSENFTVDQVDNTTVNDFNIADVNQDGIPDIVATWECPAKQVGTAYETCAAIDVIYGQGNGKTLAKTVITNYNNNGIWSPLAVDVNGDGVADIEAVPYLSEGVNEPSSFYVWLGNPDGTFQQTPLTYTPTTHGSGTIAAADFNRDGMMDFVESLPTDHETEAYINGGVRGPCATSSVSPTVTVCQPVNNTYTPSPVTIQADAYDRYTVTAMQEYIDNQEVYSAGVTSFTKSWAEPVGTHLFVTKAWDDTGASFRSNRTVTVYNGTPWPACPTAENSASICLPGGTTASSPVHILGNGWTQNVPTAAQLFIDGDLVVNNKGCDPSGDNCDGGTSYIDTTQSLSSGTHQLVFKLWDNKGNAYGAHQSITVN